MTATNIFYNFVGFNTLRSDHSIKHPAWIPPDTNTLRSDHSIKHPAWIISDTKKWPLH